MPSFCKNWKAGIDVVVKRFTGTRRNGFTNGQIFFNCHPGKDIPTLRDIADTMPGPLVWGQMRKRLFIEAYGSPVSGQKPDERLHECRLTNPVSANDGDDFALVHIDIDTLQHGLPTIASPQAACLK
jgi:hypothetical protein